VRVIVCGSRTFDDEALLGRTLDRLTAKLDKRKLVIISGHAKGADRMAEAWAGRHVGVTVEVYHPDWGRHGRAAGPRRNAEMAEAAGPKGACIAFWDGVSPGTKSMIDIARRRGLKVRVIRF